MSCPSIDSKNPWYFWSNAPFSGQNFAVTVSREKDKYVFTYGGKEGTKIELDPIDYNDEEQTWKGRYTHLGYTNRSDEVIFTVDKKGRELIQELKGIPRGYPVVLTWVLYQKDK